MVCKPSASSESIWGVSAIYAKILHDPVLQESQKKFWLFKHNFRALDLTWSDYVIVNKSTWVWELHNCQLTLVTNLIKLAENHEKGNIFALAWLCLLASTSFYEWNQLNAEILQIAMFLLFCESQLFHEATFLHPSYGCYPFFVFQEENLCHDKKAQNIWVKMSTRCKVNTISEMKLGSDPLSETGCNIFA